MPQGRRALTLEERGIAKRLQAMPNVGPATAEDLVLLGITSVTDLADKDPEALWAGIEAIDGVPHDPCVRDVFAACIDYARTGVPRKWWEFTPERGGRRRP
ncbi:MAG TPA: helix-hairpin-helix domain-containing protein [bacterium]|nr:helix-hairpin-helix domain-containing protein [bacterium]